MIRSWNTCKFRWTWPLDKTKPSLSSFGTNLAILQPRKVEHLSLGWFVSPFTTQNRSTLHRDHKTTTTTLDNHKTSQKCKKHLCKAPCCKMQIKIILYSIFVLLWAETKKIRCGQISFFYNQIYWQRNNFSFLCHSGGIYYSYMYIVYENKCLFQVDFATLTQSQFWKRNRSGSVFVSSFQGKTNTEIEYYCVSTVPWHREGPIFCYYIKPFCHHNNVDTYVGIRDWVWRPTVTTFHSYFVQQNGFI